MMYKILIVEDDRILKYGLEKCLKDEGYLVIAAENHAEVSEILKSESIDLSILDVNLPEKDGFEIYENMLHARGIPVIFLTARDEEEDVIRGFDLGAEDYITKPFSINIFLKKVAAIMKRCYSKENNLFTQGELIVNFDNREVIQKGKKLNLSPTEYKLLEIFIRNVNRVLTKDALMEGIWDNSVNWNDDHPLAVNISRLRNKLEYSYIKTVFGVGYMWSKKDAETEK